MARGAVSRGRRSRARLFLILLFLAAGALFLARRPLLVALGEALVVDEAREPADVILVLGGSLPDRMIEAADLYRKGLAPKIVLGREPSNPGMDELARRGVHIPERDELNVEVAEKLGVPRSAIEVLDGRPTSTLGEAEILIPWMRRHKVERALLVTSKIHTRRSSLVYRHFAPEIDLTVCATPYDPFDPQTWWHNRGQVRRVFFEYQKLLVYLLRDRFQSET